MKTIKMIFSNADIMLICLFTLFYGVYIPVRLMIRDFNIWSAGGSLALILLNAVLIHSYRDRFLEIRKYFHKKGVENE